MPPLPPALRRTGTPGRQRVPVATIVRFGLIYIAARGVRSVRHWRGDAKPRERKLDQQHAKAQKRKWVKLTEALPAASDKTLLKHHVKDRHAD